MAGAVQLLRGCEARRAGADHGHGAAGARPRRPRDDPALLPRTVHDRDLDLLDRDRVPLVDLEHAGGLARGRAEAAGELGKVVRPVQLLDRLGEVVSVDEVVPVGDQVPERAAVVAERDRALHAAGALGAQLEDRQRADELLVVADPLCGIPLDGSGAVELEEAAELAHQAGASDSVVRKPSPPLETAARSSSARL